MAEENKPQEVETTTTQTGVTRMGFGQLKNPTPTWVTWIFRTEFILNKALLFILSTSTMFTAGQVKESLVWIATIDFVVWGLGRFVGISKDQMEEK